MACSKFSIGDRVRFRGGTTSDKKLCFVSIDGPETFEATVVSKPYGLCYSLEWDDGIPVGLPFNDSNLEKA